MFFKVTVKIYRLIPLFYKILVLSLCKSGLMARSPARKYICLANINVERTKRKGSRRHANTNGRGKWENWIFTFCCYLYCTPTYLLPYVRVNMTR